MSPSAVGLMCVAVQVSVMASTLVHAFASPSRIYTLPVGVGRHDLIADEPLHLEPSLLWPCCGKHGFVRGGVWTEA